jgi:peptidoglycan/xylan/chitin deacetylase (PgdA/CDA1 family)
VIALTFDDGPDPRWTPAVLDALAATGARATFFVLGERAARYPDLIARTVAAGHAIGLHGHGHPRHPLAGEAAVRADLAQTTAVLAAQGVHPRLWRVPYGEPAPFTAAVAADAGLTLVGWSIDTLDWRGDAAPDMLEACRPQLAPGAVVLMHDAVGPGAPRPDCAETVALVAPLVAAARAAGLEPEALQG